MTTLRMFHCVECQRLVAVCEGCDSGRRTCSEACSLYRRRRLRREAGRRYQATPHGAAKHAERQRRYRTRRQSVTHAPERPTPQEVTAVTTIVPPTQLVDRQQQRPLPIVRLQCCTICKMAIGVFFRMAETYPTRWNWKRPVGQRRRRTCIVSARSRRLGESPSCVTSTAPQSPLSSLSRYCGAELP